MKQRWVPEPLHDARLDPGPRGARLLSAVAAAAAIAAALGVWLNLPTPQQLPAAPLTIAGESAVATLPATATETGTTSAALPTPVVSVDILVSVTGQVHNPGLVTLPDGARVADALAAAGGTLDGVDLTGLNLAAKLRDGDSVVVGAAGQGVSPDAGGPDPPSSGDTGGGTTGLININTADATTLERLPGVGPVMAANIIAWRDTNGSFATVDQLQEVAGIGPARFATLAPLVTV